VATQCRLLIAHALAAARHWGVSQAGIGGANTAGLAAPSPRPSRLPNVSSPEFKEGLSQASTYHALAGRESQSRSIRSNPSIFNSRAGGRLRARCQEGSVHNPPSYDGQSSSLRPAIPTRCCVSVGTIFSCVGDIEPTITNCALTPGQSSRRSRRSASRDTTSNHLQPHTLLRSVASQYGAQ